MAKIELQEWEVETGDERLFKLETPVRNVPARVEDMQKAVRNFGRDSLSFRPIITWDETNTTLLVTFGDTNVRRYDFLTDNLDPPDGFFFSAVIPLGATASWSDTIGITMALRQLTDPTTEPKTYTDLRTDKKYPLVWSGLNNNVNGDQLFPGDELMFIFDVENTRLKVRKFLNRIVNNDLQPKIKVFPGSTFKSRTGITRNGQFYVYHDIAPSEVSSNAIKSWMWFFVAGAGSQLIVKYYFASVADALMGENTQISEYLSSLGADTLSTNPEMLGVESSVVVTSSRRWDAIRLDTNGTKARKHDSTVVYSLDALYGRPFIVSSIDPSNAWTNHGYLRGGRPYARFIPYIFVNDPAPFDDDRRHTRIPALTRPLNITSPFESGSATLTNGETVSGSPLVPGTVLADMPLATHRRGYESGLIGQDGADPRARPGQLDRVSMPRPGGPGETLVVSPPVETIRLWIPDSPVVNRHYRRGAVASAGNVTYSDRDQDYFFTGGRGGCSTFFDFTADLMIIRQTHSGTNYDSRYGITEAPECGPDGYAVCVYWEE